MDRWRNDRATRPLETWPPTNEQRDLGARPAAANTDDNLAQVLDISQTPTMTLPAVRPGQSSPGAPGAPTPQRGAPATRPIQLEGGAAPAGDDEELERIREILVGPQMRDHDQRLRDLEGQHADLRARTATPPPAPEVPAEWHSRMAATESALARQDQARDLERSARAREMDELRTELRVVRAELTRERQSREEMACSYALAIADLTGRLDREREEVGTDPRMAHDLEEMRTQHEVLRSELARERMLREEQGQTHARALGTLTNRMDEQPDGSDTQKHAIAVLSERMAQMREDHARQFSQQSADLAARLAAEREAAREASREGHAGQAAHEERIKQLVAGAERTLAAMQAERQALTAQLAELRLHLLRQASGEAIHRAPGI